MSPKWAEWPLRKLTSKGAPFPVEQWLKSLDLAPKTKRNVRNVRAVIFNCAMRWDLIDIGVNPMALVRETASVEDKQSHASNLKRDSGVSR